MNPLFSQLKLAIGAVIILFTIYCTWYITSDHYQKQIVEIQLGMATATQTQLLADQQALIEEAAKRKLAEEDHAKDQLYINNLHDDAKRVQIHSICGGAMPPANKTGADPDRAARLLSDRVDAAFAELQSRVGQLVQRCDQLNIDARLSNASVF
jgi:hypothetical protein